MTNTIPRSETTQRPLDQYVLDSVTYMTGNARQKDIVDMHKFIHFFQTATCPERLLNVVFKKE